MNKVCLNGKFLPAEEPVLLASNRSYRYGDGLFETMRMEKGRIRLEEFHYQRLFGAMHMLGMEPPALFTPATISGLLEQLARKNQCSDAARIRFSVFRGNGGLYDADAGLQYLAEAWPLGEGAQSWNQNGLVLGLFPHARKSTDPYSSLKSANFLPYSLAARYAQEQKWNDALVLNTTGAIADSTIANLFWLKGEEVRTPAAHQGCVMGVMRRHLLERLPALGFQVRETSLSPADLLEADELFLTNAVYGMRWVGHFEQKAYAGSRAREIYHQLF